MTVDSRDSRHRKGSSMRVVFVERKDGPERLVCEAEIHFDDPKDDKTPGVRADNPLAGMKLIGFCLWRSPEGEIYVTFPSRAFGAGESRRFFDYLRSVEGSNPEPGKRVKGWIRAEYDKRLGAPQPTS